MRFVARKSECFADIEVKRVEPSNGIVVNTEMKETNYPIEPLAETI